MDKPFELEVKDRTKKIESLLVSKFGASGRGLWEKVTSVENLFPAAIVKKIKFLATVRNKLEHVDGYAFDGNPEQFLRTGDECISVLENTEPATEKPNFPNPFNNLSDDYAEIEYEAAAPSRAQQWKNPLKNLNFSAQPKALRIAVYAVGVIIACNIVIQLGAFAGRQFAAQPAGSEPAATTPTPTKPDAPTPADVSTKKIDDYAGTYTASLCDLEFYSVGKQFFLKERDGCGSQVYELVPTSASSFKFIKEIPYSEFNGTVDFIVKGGKTSGLQITNAAKRKFYPKAR